VLYNQWLQLFKVSSIVVQSKDSFLQDLGQSLAFDCPELTRVVDEVEKVDKWMLQCHKIVEPSVRDLGSLLSELQKV